MWEGLYEMGHYIEADTHSVEHKMAVSKSESIKLHIHILTFSSQFDLLIDN